MSGLRRRCFRAGMLLLLPLFTAGAARRAQPVVACLFTPDGKSVVIAHHDSIVVRAVADGSVTRTITVELQRVAGVAFEANGKILAVAGGVPGETGSVVLWDWTADVAVAEVGGFRDLATAVAFGPDVGQLAVASADKSAKVYRLRDKGRRVEPVVTLTGHAGPIASIRFAPDGKSVLTASADRSLKVWDAQSGQLLRTLSNHTDAVHCLAVRPAAAQPREAGLWAAASAGDDKTVRVWQPGIGRMMRSVRGHDGPILALAFSLDGATLFSGGSEGIVRIVDADSDKIRGAFKAHDDWIYTLATSPDGKWLVSGDWSGEVKLWDLRGDNPKRVW